MSAVVVLTVAGSDPSGGAGIQADLKTFSALGTYGAAVLTALTAQNTRGVTGVHEVPADFVTAQLDAVLGDLDVRCVKTGMLGTPEVVEAVAAAVARHRVPQLVVDPVLVATSGDALGAAGTAEAVRERLLPLATLVTPNLPEAAALLGHPVPDRAAMAQAAQELRALGAGAALVKGGHLDGSTSDDVLADADGLLELSAPRVPTRNTHGTGCTLASAVAAHLARGLPLRESVRLGKDYLTRALLHADELEVGSGSGPVHHFADWWRPEQGAAVRSAGAPR
ncbi:hydroxymethylpyrimidine/phosphomethylpyrimidine kinase [Motilibacter peucedani]|uniref:Hydroxymethylpyrimidine/phosphomethylpyrimidine kinase n=1 Tax=Motilibacter peucedani TaxID=598650 RepID=A0A420XLB5_9ACTN|nr:bifunctional hydroxymethylpyrimidine kinase/phosphomethylpyrimidine kinase [Motilibacter peucedani]RKS71272.1 hydroxymethylpyrimidine/phosphomethylpyrimidine kinase [Motilibacter peucedani]